MNFDMEEQFVQQNAKALPKALPSPTDALRPVVGQKGDVVRLEYGRCALRTFLFNPHISRYGSVSAGGDHWRGGTCTAECLAGGALLGRPSLREGHGHTPPQEGCTCGIYGTLSLEHLIGQFSGEARRIVAVIAAQGQTIIGDYGLQTEYARVIAYWLNLNPRYASSLRPEAAAEVQFQGATRFSKIEDMLTTYSFPVPRQDWLNLLGFTEHSPNPWTWEAIMGRAYGINPFLLGGP